ncbi:hypothetical protein RKD29_002156 [Streptomyces tendae]
MSCKDTSGHLADPARFKSSCSRAGEPVTRTMLVAGALAE